MGRTSRDRGRRHFSFELLEGRAVPATFGVPWGDPGRLSLSFAPDGTAIAGHSSTLFRALDARQPTSAWERQILLAFQTWAVNANINIGLVADGGQAFGVAGKSQHDPRFGDIRIGAQAMAPDVLSISVPNDPALSGTLTGDVLVNSGVRFGGNGPDVAAVLLHEAGHVLGIDDGADPKSPMFPRYLGNTRLTPADVSALQALYGTRSLDPHEGSSGNDTIAGATALQPPGGYTGATPLVGYGDVSTGRDVDVYAFRAPGNYRGTATIRLQSAGISLLAPHLTILDARGHVLADAQVASGLGDVVTLHLGPIDPNATYYAQVRGATADAFGIGSYGLAVTFDSTSRVGSAAVDTVLRGPYQSLGPNDIASIFYSPSLAFFNAGHGGDDPGAAPTLAPSPGFAANSHYEAIGSIAGPSDVALYRIKTANAPAAGRPLVLTVTLRALDLNGTAPRVTVLDGRGLPVASQVLANGGGMFSVQVADARAGGNYILRVGPATASGAPASGNFALVAQFGSAAARLSTLAADTLVATAPSRSYDLYVGQSQLMHLLLSASGAAGPPGSAVRLTVLDRSGAIVATLTAPAGDTVSGPDLLLLPGAYTFRIAAVAPPGGPTPALSFRLLGEGISDPIGPAINDPTLAPAYTAPGLPGWFAYPGSIATRAPYLFVPTRFLAGR